MNGANKECDDVKVARTAALKSFNVLTETSRAPLIPVGYSKPAQLLSQSNEASEDIGAIQAGSKGLCYFAH